jgi:hypothetical protein
MTRMDVRSDGALELQLEGAQQEASCEGVKAAIAAVLNHMGSGEGGTAEVGEDSSICWRKPAFRRRKRMSGALYGRFKIPC